MTQEQQAETRRLIADIMGVLAGKDTKLAAVAMAEALGMVIACATPHKIAEHYDRIRDIVIEAAESCVRRGLTGIATDGN